MFLLVGGVADVRTLRELMGMDVQNSLWTRAVDTAQHVFYKNLFKSLAFAFQTLEMKCQRQL